MSAEPFGSAESATQPIAAIALSPDVAVFDDGNGPGRSGAPAPPASALPCLISNSCTEEGKEKTEPLSPYRKKCRYRLIMAIEGMVKKHGIERVGFMTLTFGVPGSGRGSRETRELREQAKDLEFVQERWHSFATHVISKRYEEWVCVLQMHRDQVWHFHVIVATKIDIRTGTDIERLTDYSLPYWKRRGRGFRNEALAKEWQELRKICCKYRFGRVELLPIKKNGAALARYVAGYLSKSLGRVPTGRRNRLVRYSQSLGRNHTMRFTPNSLSGLIRRTRLKLAASMLQLGDYGDFADYFGRRWHYYLADIIASIPIPFHFAKGMFESGLATKILLDYGRDPFPYLDATTKKKMIAAHGAMHRKFTELAFDENYNSDSEEETDSAAVEADDSGDVQQQNDLFESPENPF